MNISEKIKEMRADLGKYQVNEQNEKECKLENMIMIMLNDNGYLGPGKIIDENTKYLDFMIYEMEGPVFSLSIKKEHICGLTILHKSKKEEEHGEDNAGICKALYQ